MTNLAQIRSLHKGRTRARRLQGIEVAVRALHELNHRSGRNSSGGPRPGARLVLAGGYDERLAENREYFAELRDLVAHLGLDEQVAPPCCGCCRARLYPAFSVDPRARLYPAFSLDPRPQCATNLLAIVK